MKSYGIFTRYPSYRKKQVLYFFLCEFLLFCILNCHCITFPISPFMHYLLYGRISDTAPCGYRFLFCKKVLPIGKYSTKSGPQICLFLKTNTQLAAEFHQTIVAQWFHLQSNPSAQTPAHIAHFFAIHYSTMFRALPRHMNSIFLRTLSFRIQTDNEYLFLAFFCIPWGYPVHL